MSAEDRYDSLFQWYWGETARRLGFLADPSADWRLAKAQVKQESNFDPKAVNPRSGAAGLAQFMPATAALLKIDPLDPEQAIRGQCSHLGDLWAIFKLEQGLERWKFALGAYDAGEKHIIDAQALCTKDTRPSDQWIEIVRVLPALTGANNAAETTQYVRNITASYLSWRTT